MPFGLAWSRFSTRSSSAHHRRRFAEARGRPLGLALDSNGCRPLARRRDVADRSSRSTACGSAAGSPYRAREGAFAAVRFARERQPPDGRHLRRIPTCSVRACPPRDGDRRREHAEDAPTPALPHHPGRLSVPRRATGVPVSRRLRHPAGAWLARSRALWRGRDRGGVFCNYEVNPAFRERIERSDLRITRRRNDDEIAWSSCRRTVHLGCCSSRSAPRARGCHPAVMGFVRAAHAFRSERSPGELGGGYSESISPCSRSNALEARHAFEILGAEPVVKAPQVGLGLGRAPTGSVWRRAISPRLASPAVSEASRNSLQLAPISARATCAPPTLRRRTKARSTRASPPPGRGHSEALGRW